MLFTSVAALAAVLPLAFAAPAPVQVGESQAFSIDQVAVHPHSNYTKSGARAYYKSLNRYNANIPTEVSKAAAAAAVQSGAVTTTPEANDQEYLSPVQIGTPAQTLMLDFDTGSADLWVFSSELPTSESKGHTIYTSGSSSSAKVKSGYTWSIMYQDGSGSAGNVYADKVVIGGVTATSQAVEAATTVSSSFVADTQNDGLVGLAFSSINTVMPTQQTTFFDTVKSTLALPVFCSYLKHAAAGVYDFGFIDSTKYTGTIGYSAIDTSMGYWLFTAGAYKVGSTTYGSLGKAIADTGTSIILVPTAVVKNYYAQVSGAVNSNAEGGYIFPCSATLPDFSVTVGGAYRTVPGSYINYAALGNGQCYGGLQYNEGLSFSILGDVFLKSQYVVFDGGNTRIGMAAQK